MDVGQSGRTAYSKNSVKLGQLDQSGCIRRDGAVVFEIKYGVIYSAHGAYLGHLRQGVGVTDRGEILFTLDGD